MKKSGENGLKMKKSEKNENTGNWCTKSFCNK